MKKYVDMIMLGLGGVTMFGGIVVMILGKVGLGLLAILVGLILMAIYYVTMMRGASYLPGTNDPDGVPGHHESERTKMDQPVIGEQSPNIWEKMEK